ncbi:MAG: M20/M25/M40 family metallo-hydrolase [Verrucomicrobiota bacterium]
MRASRTPEDYPAALHGGPSYFDFSLDAGTAQTAEFIRTLWPDAKEFLKDLVGENSHTLNPEGICKNARRIIQQFASMEFSQSCVSSKTEGYGKHLILDSGGEGPPIFLISHLDTVYPPEEQTAGYAGWDDSHNRIVGPGTYDIKGGTVAMWLLIQCLSRLHPHLFPRFRWILAWNAAEERLCADFSAAVMDLVDYEPLACLVFEGDNRRQEGLEIVVARSGLARYRLSVQGRSTHSGNGHAQGVNAIVRVADLVLEVSALTDYSRNTTVNVGVIRGGVATNRVPDFAEALFEVRYRDRTHYEEVKAKLLALCDSGNLNEGVAGSRCEVSMELLEEIPSWPEEQRNIELAEIWSRAGKSCGHPVAVGCRSGLSDANFFASRFRTLDGLGPRGGNAHSAVKDGPSVRITEFVDQDSFLSKTLVNTLAILELLGSVGLSSSDSNNRLQVYSEGNR